MINLIITILGVILLIVGFYSMSFGFSTPPNFISFFLGLCAAVLGLVLVIIFGSNAEISGRTTPKPSSGAPSTLTETRTKTKTGKVDVTPSEEEKKTKMLETVEKTIKPKPRIEKPKKEKMPEVKDEIIEDEKDETTSKSKPPTSAPPQEKITKPPEVEPEKSSEVETSPEMDKPPTKPRVKRPDIGKPRTMETQETDEEFVKKRLDRLKENYIQNAKDIEGVIVERLNSFKGSLGKLKSESEEPGIIWSFDAGDVQEAMIETISKADYRILMMYPWVRNLDVNVLQKLIQNDSMIIVQEASLDDDASVEILKLLMDNKVEVRTMPHVHTVAVVSDDDNGLIISTDPIYESFDVGVIYKDHKFIKEIERLFEDAWSISQDVDLEIKS